MKKVVKVFICSPYGDHNSLSTRRANVNRQIDIAFTLTQAGYLPLVPLFNHYMAQRHPGLSREFWLEQSSKLLTLADAVFIPLAFENKYTAGMAREVIQAEKAGIPIVYTINKLRNLFDYVDKGDKF